MKKYIKLSFVFLCLISLCGCQSTSDIVFYDITEANKEFSVQPKNGKPGHGPIKSFHSKSGASDFSDGKSFQLNAFGQ